MNFVLDPQAKTETLILDSHHDNTMRLKLVRDDLGEVDLVAVDEEGSEWYLIGLTKTGEFYRHEFLPDDLGFQVNGDGQIEEQGDPDDWDDDDDDDWDDDLTDSDLEELESYDGDPLEDEDEGGDY